jgi:RNAse (barnase) inhibitor barstar
MRRVEIDTARITDQNSFHAVFAEIFGFPSYYGKNMDAWIDCMSDEIAGTIILLDLKRAEEFKQRLPDVFESIIKCSAFVNQRYENDNNSRLYLGLVG